ncbi:5919_t:CDS:10 [Diversispora eburnea]|uniref:5919_t:CDS:1 n=1 Tax=Diversispora eburnea TaxID=1213867 RepID=A0A9N8VGL9_9GLOM|nr:5919_t:CDS:10 [Diversispora eburnea]
MLQSKICSKTLKFGSSKSFDYERFNFCCLPEVAAYYKYVSTYDVVLKTRKIDPNHDRIYYPFLLKFVLVPGNDWNEKFENFIKSLGMLSNDESNNWISNSGNSSSSDDNVSTDSILKLKQNEIYSSSLFANSIESVIKSPETYNNYNNWNDPINSKSTKYTIDINFTNFQSSTNFTQEEEGESLDNLESDGFENLNISNFKGLNDKFILIDKEIENLNSQLDNHLTINNEMDEIDKGKKGIKNQINRNPIDLYNNSIGNVELLFNVFERWRDRFNNYVSLGEMAEVTFFQWKRAAQRKKKLKKMADNFILNRFFLYWYSGFIQKFIVKQKRKELLEKVFLEWHYWTEECRKNRLSSSSSSIIQFNDNDNTITYANLEYIVQYCEDKIKGEHYQKSNCKIGAGYEGYEFDYTEFVPRNIKYRGQEPLPSHMKFQTPRSEDYAKRTSRKPKYLNTVD